MMKILEKLKRALIFPLAGIIFAASSLSLTTPVFADPTPQTPTPAPAITAPITNNQNGNHNPTTTKNNTSTNQNSNTAQSTNQSQAEEKSEEKSEEKPSFEICLEFPPSMITIRSEYVLRVIITLLHPSS